MSLIGKRVLFRQLFDRISCTYTYLLADKVTKEAILIDPVLECVDRDLQTVQELGLNILIKFLNLLTDCPLGHTSGCVTYVDTDNGLVFTGDALLIRGCGRTDFQQGDSGLLYESIHQKIFTLPDNFYVLPAHDYKGQLVSTVSEEKRFNPRLTKSKEEFIDIMANLKLDLPKMIDIAVPNNLILSTIDHRIRHSFTYDSVFHVFPCLTSQDYFQSTNTNNSFLFPSQQTCDWFQITGGVPVLTRHLISGAIGVKTTSSGGTGAQCFETSRRRPTGGDSTGTNVRPYHWCRVWSRLSNDEEFPPSEDTQREGNGDLPLKTSEANHKTIPLVSSVTVWTPRPSMTDNDSQPQQRVVFDSTDPLSTNPSHDITLQHLSNRWMCCIVLCCLPFHPFLSTLVASEDENRLSGDRRLHTRLDWYDWTPTPVLLTPVVKSWVEVYSTVTTNSLNGCSSGPHVLTRMTPSMRWKVFTKTSPAGH
ncbi:unnamed protein product [Oppiella nova]|uniref:Metallo-beta-lactamase domain-containing protein n=1 Tax=Oppiella nova TaxID=334625 RepID=A0A7R9LPL3_9ACAR|nr:unnamed protein product [Oppiella nova]CAG2165087.1 unnamed protein product [Oppiella nova]